jgi:hypothetical protein
MGFGGFRDPLETTSQRNEKDLVVVCDFEHIDVPVPTPVLLMLILAMDVAAGILRLDIAAAPRP